MGQGASTEAKNDERSSEPNETTRLADSTTPSALVIVGPSGVGKGTLIKRVMEGSDKFGFSCSHTTRSPRPGEKDGKDYYFTDRATFEKGVKDGKFLEHAEVHGNLYGTTYQAVEIVGQTGRCCVLDIDVQGARLVRESKLKAIFIFIAPPTIDELEQRLKGRGTESDEQVTSRLSAAAKEMESLKEAGLYDYVLFNEDVDIATQQLAAVAERAISGQVSNESEDGGMVALMPPQEEVEQEPESSKQGTTSHLSVNVPQPGTPLTPAAPPKEGLQRWKGKVALVTGASAGIGWSICHKLAMEGLRVVAVARRRERLEALQQNLVRLGVPIADFLPVVCDITKEAEVVALPRIVVKRWPGAGIDILVNNAGMGRSNASLFDGKTSSWVEMISTNVLGPCMCTREALQDMKRREQWGHIINISSMAGHRVPDAAGDNGAFYAATKHALRAITEGLRQEARGKKVGLRVSQISPGMVETEFDVVRNFGNGDPEAYSKFKCLQPEDVAQAVLWVLGAPDHVDVHDILMRPISQPL